VRSTLHTAEVHELPTNLMSRQLHVVSSKTSENTISKQITQHVVSSRTSNVGSSLTGTATNESRVSQTAAEFAKAVEAGIDVILGDSEDSKHEQDATLRDLVEQGTAALNIDAVVSHEQAPAEALKLLRQPILEEPGMVPPDEPRRLSPAQLQKAIATLNDMISKAQARLDRKAIDCKVFKTKNRATLKQVNGDISRLSETLANLERSKVSTLAAQGQAATSQQTSREDLRHQSLLFNDTHASLVQQLAGQKADLEVAAYILDLTKCPSATFLAQRFNGAGAVVVAVQDLELGN